MNVKHVIAIAILIGMTLIGCSEARIEFTGKLGTPGNHSDKARLPNLPVQIGFDQTGNRIISAQEDGAVIAWDIASGTATEIARTGGLFGYCRSDQLMVVHQDDAVFLVDLKTNARKLVIKGAYHHAAWSADCAYFAIANEDAREIKRYAAADPSTHVVIHTADPVRNGIALSADGLFLAAAEGTYKDDTGHDTKLEVFRFAGADSYTRRAARDDGSTVLGMWKMAFTPDSQSLIVGTQASAKSGLRAIATGTAGERWNQTGFESYWVRAIAVSPDGKLIATGEEKGWLRVWNATNGVKLREVQTDLVIQSVTFSPDSKRLAAALWDSTIGIVDLKDL